MVDFEKDNQDTIVLSLYSEMTVRMEFDGLVASDTSFAVFSVLFVIIWFIFYLGSLFLALIGISLILLSFSFTAFLYQGLLRISFFTSLHTLVIFIVLGIAADDIFVFIDAWR